MNFPANPLAAIPLALPAVGRTASGRPWRLAEADPREALAVADAAGVAPVIARALVARGVTAACAGDHLAPSLRRAMPDPFVLQDMERAALRLADAVTGGETIGVFGDYDVDGTTAAAIVKLYVEKAGGRVEVHLPDRILEGYGPTLEAFRSLKARGAGVIVTVDCGATAHTAIEGAATEGFDVIVLDHHQMDGPPPARARAVVNPNRLDDVSGLAELSAAGVAFMAVTALNRALRERGWFVSRSEPALLGLLDLAALGLVCDVMPMTGLARVIVAQGLKVLGEGGNPGLAALARQAGAKGRPTAYHLGFLLGPRINAAGRVDHARLALDLLTTDDPARRQELAERLHRMNADRQAIEESALASAVAAAEAQGGAERGVIVVAGEGWHPGVIGIVAGRLKERFDAPAFVISLDGGTGKGSARSIAGVDLGAAVRAAKEAGHLIAGGGHAMAAGFSLARDAVGAFADFLAGRLGAEVARARAGRTLAIDGVVAPSAVSAQFAQAIEQAGPFGPGNPEPVFALEAMRVTGLREVGSGHLSMTLAAAGGESVRAIAFRAGESGLADFLAGRARVHVAGRIRIDDWRGGSAGQLHLVDAGEPA